MKREIERLAYEAVTQIQGKNTKDPNELMQEFSEHFAMLIIKKCIALTNEPESTAIANYFDINYYD